ncbi:DUF1538 domain-containing protein [Spirochaetales bacterium NM-380-WT-3C1]|uniref:DUF1538 domain-containing protein n=1 Tax=Bullifex porci TaxID=2606638 RepID=A0A7X2TS46_9SPIO|nr:DUF1538 domain-containing protein [Bullifex porci]MSU06638.1 DUF1538 domain-containing protein [Bullifex porci]
MDILKQLKEVTLSVLPIALIASILSLLLKSSSVNEILNFGISCLCVIFGLTLFLTGVNNGLMPVGNKIGATITKSRSLLLIILVSLCLGFIITVAEPDVEVLAKQVAKISNSLSESTLIIAIASGVALFLMLSLIRTILHLPLKVILFVGYSIVLILALFVPPFFVSIGFDAGGATTGPMSVPFIMALGMGLAKVRGKDEESEFGYVALSSIGPILAVMVLGTFINVESAGASVADSASHGFFQILLSCFKSTGISFIPIFAVCVIMQLFFMKLPFHKALRMFLGMLYAYVGLVLFSCGVEFSFSQIANTLGATLAEFSKPLLVLLGGVLGSCVVLAEPAIWVLTEQVEDVSQGSIKKSLMMVTLCVAVSIAVMLGLTRSVFHLPILVFIIPCYAVILILMLFTPKLFSAIAFDSGGVATGPMSSAFLLPYAIGAAGGSSDASFGLIAFIAMMPILCIEVLGLIYRLTLKKGKKNE